MSTLRPRTQQEEALAAIWRVVLKRDRIGVNENFFELGGDSIIAIQMISRANRAGVKVALRQIFEHQTIASLAAVAVTSAPATEDEATGDAPLTRFSSGSSTRIFRRLTTSIRQPCLSAESGCR